LGASGGKSAAKAGAERFREYIIFFAADREKTGAAIQTKEIPVRLCQANVLQNFRQDKTDSRPADNVAGAGGLPTINGIPQ
jgi:hypothetical protein